MSVLEWVFVGSLSLAFLTFLLSIVCIILFFSVNSQLKKMKQKRPKNKNKKKRWLKMRRQLDKKKKKYLGRTVMLLVITVLSVASGAYVRYYQMTNLTTEDGNTLIQSYFLTDEVEKSLVNLQNGADPEKTKKTLDDRTSLLASYGTNAGPSNGLSKEGQKLLVRYYARIRDFSINTYSLSSEQLSDPETVSSYLDTLNQIKSIQKKIFKQFSVNEAALKQKK